MGIVVSTIKPYFGYTETNSNSRTKLDDHTRTLLLEDKVKKLQKKLRQNEIGNYITREELNDYFKNMTNAIDHNLDEVVTKKELEIYVQTQLINSKEEIENWKKSYELLQDRYDKLLDSIKDDTVISTRDIESSISTQALKEYIEKEILEDPDANLRLIPDPLERKIYLTVYKTIMKSLEKVCNTTSIDLLNHRLTFNINRI